MRTVLRVTAFSALLVLLILGGLRLGRTAEGPETPPIPFPVSGHQSTLDLPASLAALRTSGAELVPLGRAGVLDGWLLRKADGSVLTVYAAPGGHVVAGLLYGPDGRELTGGQLERIAAPPRQASQTVTVPAKGNGVSPASPGRPVTIGRRAEARIASGQVALADAVRAAAGGSEPTRHSLSGAGPAALFSRSLDMAAFTIGEGGPDLVTFLDPGCPWSRQAAAELGQRALDGAFRLHAVPVGLMSAESHAHAAGILAAPRPGLAWYRWQPSPATTEDIARLEANNTLWRAFGAKVVPWLAWRGADGAVHTHEGLPASADFMGTEVRSLPTGSLLLDSRHSGGTVREGGQ